MPPLTAEQRRVIAATARVAGMATLIACGPKKATEPVAEALPTEVPTTVVPDQGPASTGEQAVADEVASDLSFETCLPLTAETLSDFGFGKEPESVSDEVVACCELLLDAQDSRDPQLGLFDARWGCCTVVEEPGRMACTPWGPPAPPAMV